MRDFLLIYINGQAVEIKGEKASMMLADFLRYELRLTGTKIVCAEGDCGACTVLKYNSRKGYFEPINSCITTLFQLDGSSIVTVDHRETLSPIQKSMMTVHASQCGFCTPGFVMALTGLAEKKTKNKEEKISEREVKNCLTGNLCRCTGYQPIVRAGQKMNLKEYECLSKIYFTKKQRDHLKKIFQIPLKINDGEFEIYAPKTLKDASKYLLKNKTSKIISGGTDLGVLFNKGKFQPTKYLSLHLIQELYEVKKIKSSHLRVGARVTLSELRSHCKEVIPELARFLDIFASPQIKNVATLAGNLANASPIADTPPFLLAVNCIQHIFGPNGYREVALDEFYLGYKKTNFKNGEIIAFVEFEIPRKNENLSLYKSSQRKDLDISCVNAAFRLEIKSNQILSARLALGGVGPTPMRLKKTEKLLLKKNVNSETLELACRSLQGEIAPISDLRGSHAFRRVTAENFFRHFFMNLGVNHERPAP